MKVSDRPLHVHLLDTSVASDNVGDEIIMDSVLRHGSSIWQDAWLTSSSSHDGMGRLGRRHVASSDLVFLCGTNALSHRNMIRRKPIWSVAKQDVAPLKGKVVLFGVGWNKYSATVERSQARILRQLLSDKFLHSVRDAYTAHMLASIGITNTVVTGCPTLWSLGESSWPSLGADSPSVILSLTHHKPHELDHWLIKLAKRTFDSVFFWPQQIEDLEYLRSIGKDDVASFNVVSPTLKRFAELLATGHVSSVGTRLHAGIFALQHRVPTCIVAIDNRATEMHRDFNIPIVERSKLNNDLSIIETLNRSGRITISMDRIERFLNQFGRMREADS